MKQCHDNTQPGTGTVNTGKNFIARDGTRRPVVVERERGGRCGLKGEERGENNGEEGNGGEGEGG